MLTGRGASLARLPFHVNKIQKQFVWPMQTPNVRSRTSTKNMVRFPVSGTGA